MTGMDSEPLKKIVNHLKRHFLVKFIFHYFYPGPLGTPTLIVPQGDSPEDLAMDKLGDITRHL